MSFVNTGSGSRSNGPQGLCTTVSNATSSIQVQALSMWPDAPSICPRIDNSAFFNESLFRFDVIVGNETVVSAKQQGDNHLHFVEDFIGLPVACFFLFSSLDRFPASSPHFGSGDAHPRVGTGRRKHEVEYQRCSIFDEKMTQYGKLGVPVRRLMDALPEVRGLRGHDTPSGCYLLPW